MAKARKKAGLPKKVAGVRIPKAVRKSKSLGSLVNSDLGREILADALVAAAAAAAAALTRTRAAKAAGHAIAGAGGAAVDAGSDAVRAGGDLVETATGALAGVVSDAARSILPASLVADDKPRYLSKASGLDSRKRSKAERGGKAAIRKRRKKRD